MPNWPFKSGGLTFGSFCIVGSNEPEGGPFTDVAFPPYGGNGCAFGELIAAAGKPAEMLLGGIPVPDVFGCGGMLKEALEEVSFAGVEVAEPKPGWGAGFVLVGGNGVGGCIAGGIAENAETNAVVCGVTVVAEDVNPESSSDWKICRKAMPPQ